MRNWTGRRLVFEGSEAMFLRCSRSAFLVSVLSVSCARASGRARGQREPALCGHLLCSLCFPQGICCFNAREAGTRPRDRAALAAGLTSLPGKRPAPQGGLRKPRFPGHKCPGSLRPKSIHPARNRPKWRKPPKRRLSHTSIGLETCKQRSTQTLLNDDSKSGN